MCPYVFFEGMDKTKNYRLAARLRGGELALEPALKEELRQELRRRIAQLEAKRARLPESGPESDRATLAAAVAWERYGDFLDATGSLPQALRAWREAAEICLCGGYYENGGFYRPARWLRLRREALLEKVREHTRGDRHLEKLFEKGL